MMEFYNKNKKNFMDKIFERYEILCKDVKHQINFIDDYYNFDFSHLEETLNEMKELQKKIRQNKIDEYKNKYKEQTHKQ